MQQVANGSDIRDLFRLDGTTGTTLIVGDYAGLGERERFVVNVAAVYRDLGHDAPDDALTLLDQMAAYGSG